MRPQVRRLWPALTSLLARPTIGIAHLSLALRAVALPAVALPAVALPAIALPAVALPAVALPAIALPAIALPAVALLVASPAVARAADLPSVRYAVRVESRTWQPIELSAVEAMIEGAATEPLTRTGSLQLARSGFADLKQADYTLLLQGRFIEEAEKLSIYLTFGPGKREELPSFHVSETESLGRRSQPEMQKVIEGMARRAGERLAALLAPRLASQRLALPPPPVEGAVLPWAWGEIDVPATPSARGDVATVLDPRQEDHARANALAAIAPHVFDQTVAREAVELCVLRDPSPRIRARCVEALEPVARTRIATQRLLLHAMRQEVEDEVLTALNRLAQSFVGLSRKETIETWLELVASDATPAQGAEEVARLLAKEGDVPNLDLAVATCLQQQALAYGKRQACAQELLPVIPKRRRMAVVWRYLESLRVFDQGEQNTLEDVLAHTVGRGSEPLEPAVAELFLTLAERHSTGRARGQALYVAARHADPQPTTMERLLTLARDPTVVREALQATQTMVHKKPGLCAMTLGALERLRGEPPLLRQKFRGNPREELEDAVKRLSRECSRVP